MSLGPEHEDGVLQPVPRGDPGSAPQGGEGHAAQLGGRNAVEQRGADLVQHFLDGLLSRSGEHERVPELLLVEWLQVAAAFPDADHAQKMESRLIIPSPPCEAGRFLGRNPASVPGCLPGMPDTPRNAAEVLLVPHAKI